MQKPPPSLKNEQGEKERSQQEYQILMQNFANFGAQNEKPPP